MQAAQETRKRQEPTKRQETTEGVLARLGEQRKKTAMIREAFVRQLGAGKIPFTPQIKPSAGTLLEMARRRGLLQGRK